MRTDASYQSVCRTALAAIAVILLCGEHVLAQEVWKWVDKSGVTHYSDQPVPGAVRVDLNVQTYAADEAAVPSTATSTTSRPAAPAVSYELIEVWKPEDDSTISGTGGQVSVSIRVLPRVHPGHSLRLELDGTRVSEPNSQQTDFTLNEIARGTHTLSASIVTRDGQTLIQSTPVKFHVLQPVVAPRATR